MGDMNSMTTEKKRVRVVCCCQENAFLQLLRVCTFEQHVMSNSRGTDPPPGAVPALYIH